VLQGLGSDCIGEGQRPSSRRQRGRRVRVLAPKSICVRFRPSHLSSHTTVTTLISTYTWCFCHLQPRIPPWVSLHGSSYCSFICRMAKFWRKTSCYNAPLQLTAGAIYDRTASKGDCPVTTLTLFCTRKLQTAKLGVRAGLGIVTYGSSRVGTHCYSQSATNSMANSV
jgi:hypothetical protein